MGPGNVESEAHVPGDANEHMRYDVEMIGHFRPLTGFLSVLLLAFN
jgi:hypothetical protein